MEVTGNTLFMVNQMLSQKAKDALVMVWFASSNHTGMIVPENDPTCLDYEALMALGLITDVPGTLLPDARKFWLTRLGHEYTKGLVSLIPVSVAG